MNSHLTDREVEEKLFALAAATRAQGEPEMSALILRALREEHARLMRQRRRAQLAVGSLAACLLAAPCLWLLPGQHAAAPMAAAAPPESAPSLPLTCLSAPCGKGIALELPDDRPGRAARLGYYNLTLEATPL